MYIVARLLKYFMTNFQKFPLPDSLKKSLEKQQFNQATEVQIKTIPEALAGKDVIVSAPMVLVKH